MRILALVILGLTLSTVLAQNGVKAEVGDPPVASLIAISAPDEDGVVIIEGAAGSVFPGAQVAIRNLYTERIVYTQAGITGAFSSAIYGPGNTPFWISPAGNIPNNLRNLPGSLPGGPGTIIYGAFSTPPAPAVPITHLVIDGDDSEWAAYSQAALMTGDQTVQALLNQESLYVAASSDISQDYERFRVEFSLDDVVYDVTLDPRLDQLATLRRILPNPRDLGTLIVAAAQDSAIELRIPLALIGGEFNPTIESATIETVRYLMIDGAELGSVVVQQDVPLVAETDGVVHLDSPLGNDATHFYIAGSVAQGASLWMAQGRINQLSFNAGDQLILELDVRLNAPALADGLVGLHMIGQLGLQPVIGAEGWQAPGGMNSNNGWSNLLTPSGLPIANVQGDAWLGDTFVVASQIIRRDDQLLFPLRFMFTIPDDLPAGMYVPIFQGLGQVGDGERFRWQDNGVLGAGSGISRLAMTRLPLVLNVGEVNSGRLLWTLLYDTPSDGSRGIVSEEDRDHAALSNYVRFDSPTYILPRGTENAPATYPLEPYLLNQLPNTYDTTASPLVPFMFPGGRLEAQIMRPDGTIDDLGTTSILQNQLSTDALDERLRFGAQSPVDVYRLTTLNPTFTNYVFDQYGEYTINLSGSLEDTWRNRYEGGGTYKLLIAELLDLTPGVLPGAPFEVGDAFNASLHLSPGVPAEVTINARLYPLDGGAVVETEFTGQANQHGYFHLTDDFRFSEPGEYIIDYEVRYTDAEGRLWAASLRSAGVVADRQSAIVAHGQRGLDDFNDAERPAWFNTAQYPSTTEDVSARLNYPYHSGDVAWIGDGVAGGIEPVLRVQDSIGPYENWFVSNWPDYVGPGGLGIRRMVARDELPLGVFGTPDSPFAPALVPDGIVNNAYSYLSAVRPDVTARQFIQGGVGGDQLAYWDNDNPYNGQLGTGLNGDVPGDYLFLFGGAVIRNEAAGVLDTASYAALGIVIDPENDPLGPRVYPPYRGQAGGPDGGPLVIVDNERVEMFFHPTGVRPGEVLTRGDALAVAGHVAPPLDSIVSVTITSPGGAIRHYEGAANTVGYFYDPTQDFAVDEIGVWTVEISVRHEGETSAGLVEPPPPTGGILGVQGGRFPVFVLPADAEPLPWEQANIQNIPPTAPYNFNFRLPDEWSDVQVYLVVTTPSYVLENGTIRPSGGSFSYQYNTTRLNDIRPTLENNLGGAGASSSDVVTITFVITGMDGVRFQIRSRTFTVMYDRLLTMEG
jgi:hypothetical protein